MEIEEKQRVNADPQHKKMRQIRGRKSKKRLHIYSGTQNFFMEKIYHIYAGNICLMHSLKEQDFLPAWRTVQNMIAIMNTEYKVEDLSYEELLVNKELEASY